MDKPKSKQREQSTNPLSVLFSISTPFEFVSSFSFDECLKRLAAQRTENPPTRLEHRVFNRPLITVEISQDEPDAANFVIKDHQARIIQGYKRSIKGRLEKLDDGTFVLTNILALGGPLGLAVGLGLWVLFAGQIMRGSTGIFLLIAIAASLYVFVACYFERRALFDYITTLLAFDLANTWSKAFPEHKTPTTYRLVDDGEVIPIDEQSAAQNSHHGSNSK
jgi:hypothetical protein